MYGDLHIHTRISFDSNNSPLKLLKTARKLNLSVLGVVDHGTPKGGYLTEKMNRDKNIIILPGQETKTPDGEILVFCCDYPLKGDLIEICEKAKDENWLTIVPHPFDRLRKGVEENLDKIRKLVDAIEIFNGRTIFSKFNEKAERYAKKFKIPGVAGSDSHLLEELGNGRTIFNCDANRDEIIEAIRKGKISVFRKKSPVFVHLKSYGVRLEKILKIY